MATLLEGVNEVLKRTRVIDSNGAFVSLTDQARQMDIDLAVQVWNETVDQLYSNMRLPRPNILAEDTITLVDGDRDYELATDLVILYWPLLDETNGRYIVEYAGGYHNLITDELNPGNFTGLPIGAVIRPTDGELFLDRIPTSEEDGLIYKYRYQKDSVLAATSDTFPFKDIVFRALVPAVAELWKFEKLNQFNEGLYRASMGRAARYVRQEPQRGQWVPRHAQRLYNTDPLDENAYARSRRV